MSDKMDEIAFEDPDETRATEEVRAAWLGLIRLLAREVIQRLDPGESPPGAVVTKSKVTDPAEPPGAKDSPSR